MRARWIYARDMQPGDEVVFTNAGLAVVVEHVRVVYDLSSLPYVVDVAKVGVIEMVRVEGLTLNWDNVERPIETTCGGERWKVLLVRRAGEQGA